MLPQLLSALVVVVIAAVVFPLMMVGWRNRRRRQADLRPAATIPEALGAPVLEAGILYVATTSAGDPLDRITLKGLAYRGRGRLQVWPAGVGITVDGERAVFLPREALIAAGTSTWAIDKAVERGGLLRIDWRTQTSSGPKEVETCLRVLEAEDRERVLDALQAAMPSRPAQGAA